MLTACQQKPKTTVTPWGATIDVDGGGESADTVTDNSDDRYTLKDILQGGEMIMLTLSGPETYYDYHGKGLGVHYLLCEKLAEHLGVTLRVDVCRDTLDLLQRLRDGEGDIAAFPVSRNNQKGFISCNVTDTVKVKANKKEKEKAYDASDASWIVSKDNNELAEMVRKWFKPEMFAQVRQQQEYILTVGSVTRHVNPFFLSTEKGTISHYDHLFRKYSTVAGMDWTMIASQCYQESCFDPKAHSWAGACGLMQIIPTTADHLGLARSRIYEPEANVAAAARYMKELQGLFADIANPQERLKFALAAYNGGYHHVRDAMALTKKYGGMPHSWSDVRTYILALAQPAYYTDPIVKNGYMRGSETANYVDMIFERYGQYKRALRTGGKINSSVKPKVTSSPSRIGSSTLLDVEPHRASKENKWRKQ